MDLDGRFIIFVASGDLSHNLKDHEPYGYIPKGPAFDIRLTDDMAAGDFPQFLTMDSSLYDRAAECGLRSFQIMAGAVNAKLLSYEGTLGVGYSKGWL